MTEDLFTKFCETPQTCEETSEIIRKSRSENLAVYIQGGHTSASFGGNPSRQGGMLITTGMNRVLEYPYDDMTITVESGITLDTLQAKLREHHQYLPIDAPQGANATLGGIIATAWSGPRRYGSMRPRDQIIGIGFVDGTGRFVRGGGKVVKNVAGYDFPKLLTGSCGSLGVITEMTFKVRPLPETTALAWISLNESSELSGFLERLNTSQTRATAIEVLNQPAAQAIGTPHSLPTDQISVALFFDDSAKAVKWQCDQIHNELPDGSVCSILTGQEAVTVQSVITEAVAGAGRSLVIKVVSPQSFVSKIFEKTDHGMWEIQSHAGLGVTYLRLREGITTGSAKPKIQDIRREVSKAGGFVTIPVCPAEHRDEWKLWGEPRPDWELMAGLKRALDPSGILNPGRFLGLS
jgi:glycolate oxidase FAD binding subunit